HLFHDEATQMDIDSLLTTTRSARKSLDLDAAVDLGEIRACLRIGLQAANGSNQQSWRWIVVTDAAVRSRLGALYHDADLSMIGAQMTPDQPPGDPASGRLIPPPDGLVQPPAAVPVLVIPCYEPYLPRTDGDESFHRATLYGSIFPAVWNFQLALHTHGY